MTKTFTVAWYRSRGTFARRWTSYLSVILLIGLTGGLAMGSIAGARRTQSSYPTFLASTNPSTLTMAIFGGGNGQAPPSILSKITALPDVAHVRTLVAGAVVPLNAAGAPRLNTLNNAVTAGSTDGYLVDQDRLAVLQGHLTNPKSDDQVVVTPGAAKVWGVHVGERVPLGFFSPSQSSLPGFGTAKVKPEWTVDATVTGIVALNSEIVQDDIDRSYGFAFLTPAMVRRAVSIDPDWVVPVDYAIQLRDTNLSMPTIEKELTNLVPAHDTYEFHVTAGVVSTVELALKPESVALGSFGVIAALVCLILSVQALARQLRDGSADRRVLHALGASRAVVLAEGLLGALGALVLGVGLAVLVAFALSPLSPLGPVRVVYPTRGLNFDATVLGLGALVLLVVLGAATTLVALLNSPNRLRPDRVRGVRRSNTVARLQSSGLPVAAALGVHFALESPRGRGEVPVRSVLFGAVLAVTLMVTTLTFANSFSTLVSRPALYGWNWSYVLNPTNVVPPSAIKSLNHDPDVAAWSGVDYNEVDIDGDSIPVILAKPHATVMPPILVGHGLKSNDQIVLGNATLALLHKHVGQSVVVSFGSPASAPAYVPPTTLSIVGTATFPAVGYATAVADHTSMGTGALISLGILPPAFLKVIAGDNPLLNGPELVFVRMRPNVSPAAGQRNLRVIARAANAVFASHSDTFGNTVAVLSVQRPAQIVDYRSVGDTPVVLAGGLAIGAVVALALTLIASVRRRRHDLAVLKTLGFTRRQLVGAISAQASVDAIIGVVVGVPLGILLGRQLWTLFAQSINAVPHPTVPTLALVVVSIGTLVAANLAAAWPGRRAATTPPGLALRAE